MAGSWITTEQAPRPHVEDPREGATQEPEKAEAGLRTDPYRSVLLIDHWQPGKVEESSKAGHFDRRVVQADSLERTRSVLVWLCWGEKPAPVPLS